MNKTHIIHSLTLVTMLFIGLLMFALAGTVVAIHTHYKDLPVPSEVTPPSKSPLKGPWGSGVGDMSKEAIEAEFGPINTKALNEVKNGLFGRRFQSCRPCRPSYSYSAPAYRVARPQVVYSTPSMPCAPCNPVVITPATRVLPRLSTPAPVVVTPSCPDGQCPTVIAPTPRLLPRLSRPSPIVIIPSCPGGNCPAPAVQPQAQPQPPSAKEVPVPKYTPGNPLKVQPSN